MATEVLVNGLKALLKEAENKEMDSFTARQKLLQAFDLADPLALKVTDPLMRQLIDYTIYSWREYLDKYEKFNFDLQDFCNIILFTWFQYVDRMKSEQEEKKRREMLTELKKQGKI
jgi:hypothetical protein